MSVLERITQRRTAVVGLGVVAISSFGAAVPAFAAAAPTRTTLSTSTPTVGVGSAIKFKATVKPADGSLAKPAGTVTFREGTTVLGTSTLALVGTLQTAKLSINTLAVGSHTVIATYNGSTLFASSESLPVTVVVGKSTTSTTLTSSTGTPVLGQNARAKAVVKQVAGTVQPTGTVTFTEGATALGSGTLALSGTTMAASITIMGGLPLGTHTITATYAGSSNFAGSSQTVADLITVVKGSATCTLTAKQGVVGSGKTTLIVVVKAVLPATGIPTGYASFIVDGLVNLPQQALLSIGRAQINVVDLVPGTPPHTGATVTWAGDARFLGCTGLTGPFTSQ